jgi:drug/metabolite transporter (DMT)-like permease
MPYYIGGHTVHGWEPRTEITGCIYALLAAVFGALAVVYTRGVSQHIHHSVVGFYYGLGNMFFCPIWILLINRESFPSYEWGLVGMILMIGLINFVFQSLMVYCMQYLTASMASVLIYLIIPVSYLLDFIFFT